MSKFTLVIGNKRYSSWSLRGWLLMKLSGQPFEEIVIPLRQPDTRERILEHSPAGRVPNLKDGEISLWDSLAMAEHLAERFSQAGLWPTDPAARALARSITAEMHSGFGNLRSAMPMDLFARHSGLAHPPEAMDDARRIMEIWDGARSRFGADGDFLFGRPGVADAFYAPVVSRFVTYGLDLDPVSRAYCEAVMTWPLLAEWSAEAEAEPWEIQFDLPAAPS